VNTACCLSGGEHRRRTQTCTPTTCSSSCATIFVPFLDDCGTNIQAAGQDLSPFHGLYYSCRQAVSSAGCAAASLPPPPPAYTYFPGTVTWTDARNRCRATGGDLASIHSAQQNADVRAACGSHSCWIGLSDAQTESVWLWSDGSPFDYNNWRAGEPNGVSASEDFVDVDGSGTWEDDPPGCTYCGLAGYVCAS
jgi:hypothetical protein